MGAGERHDLPLAHLEVEIGDDASPSVSGGESAHDEDLWVTELSASGRVRMGAARLSDPAMSPFIGSLADESRNDPIR